MNPNLYNPGSFNVGAPLLNPSIGDDQAPPGFQTLPVQGFTGGGDNFHTTPILNVNTGGGFSGSQWGGTLGGGSALDPSQWGMTGLGSNDAGNSVPFHTQYATGAAESGHGAGRQFLPQWQALAAKNNPKG
jgi:hypothetical protein